MTEPITEERPVRITRLEDSDPIPQHRPVRIRRLGASGPWIVYRATDRGLYERVGQVDEHADAWAIAERYLAARARTALATERHALRQRGALIGIVLFVLLAAVAGVLVWLPL